MHQDIPGDPSENPEASQLPVVPKSIGPYRVESLLQKGGMSLLYLGTHPETREPITIKVLSAKYLPHNEIVERFLKEAELIAIADHPSIVKLIGCGRWEEGYYIAMEFIQGVSLRQYLLQNPVSLKRALELVLDISYALCHLHTHGIIHRDLKPENVLITDTGAIKLIDFGIARLITDNFTMEPHFPIQKRTIGTPVYMSPEQREDPEHVSYPSDIYSLGIITYELVLGKLSHGQVHLSLMPKGLQKILSHALQTKVQDRYQDIVDFITDLSTYLNSAHLQKEKKPSDQLSELTENFRHAENFLAPLAPQNWKGVEIIINDVKGVGLKHTLREFYVGADESYALILGESSVKGAEGIIYTAVVRGMIKALLKNKIPFSQMLFKLNELLAEDPMDEIFTLAALEIITKQNTLHFTSCGAGQLWIFPHGSVVPRLIASENPPLGITTPIDLKASTHSFSSGDRLVLIAGALFKPTSHDENELPEDLLHQAIVESLNDPLQKLSDALLRKIKIHTSKPEQDPPSITFAVLERLGPGI